MRHFLIRRYKRVPIMCIYLTAYILATKRTMRGNAICFIAEGWIIIIMIFNNNNYILVIPQLTHTKLSCTKVKVFTFKFK